MNKRIIVAILIVLTIATPAVYAADIRLSSSCTLADAIIAANNDRAEGDCLAGRGADTITLTRDITLDGGLPKITSDITIEGNGYAISGDNRYRMFYNDGGALTIHDLTMTKGYVEGELITNADGTLKATTAQPIGGAIFNLWGELSIVNSSFSGNSAEWGGGAITNRKDGDLSINNSTFSRNSAEGGGAIVNDGDLSISDSTFSDNSADLAGVIFNRKDGELNVTNSTFSRNSAEGGGAIINDERGELSIINSAFSDNSAKAGGAIINRKDGELSVTNSSFSGNSADFGGAIGNDGDGELNISDSSFSRNSAKEAGGAIANSGELSISDSSFNRNSADSADSIGGAILNAEGMLSISNSTFSGNSAEGGGAILNAKGTLSIVNSAFSSNSAGGFGGAIDNRSELSIGSSTFSHNSAENGGAIGNYEGTLSMINSIIAGRDGDACNSIGGLKRNINNFIQDGSCSPAFSGDLKLGALVVPEDGSPAYFPLLSGSRAIDAADDAYCPATDQIGTERPQGAGCDIGAFEYVAES